MSRLRWLPVGAKLPGRITSAAFNTDGSLFVVGAGLDNVGAVRVYRADNGQKLMQAESTTGAVYAVAFAPDGKAVAAAGFDGVVRLYDPQTGKKLKEFTPVPLPKPATAAQ